MIHAGGGGESNGVRMGVCWSVTYYMVSLPKQHEKTMHIELLVPQRVFDIK